MSPLYPIVLTEQQVNFLHKLLLVWEDNLSLPPDPADFAPQTASGLQDQVAEHYHAVNGPGDDK